MTTNRNCINCETDLDVGQVDFCTDACRQEYIDGCEQGVLNAIVYLKQNVNDPDKMIEKLRESQAQTMPTGEIFHALLTNKKEESK